MTTREILIAARAKIAQGWTQGTSARDHRGISVCAESASAACWCITGAVYAVEASSVMGGAAIRILAAVTAPIVSMWNDKPERTQLEVLAAFDRAIRLA